VTPELQDAKRPDATAELARGFERATGTQPGLFSPAELPRLWTLEEAAEFLGMSKAWVRDHATRRQPRIACVRLGGRRALLRFRRCDLVQFVDEHWQSADGPFPKRP
jgi:hypothetical protein